MTKNGNGTVNQVKNVPFPVFLFEGIGFNDVKNLHFFLYCIVLPPKKAFFFIIAKLDLKIKKNTMLHEPFQINTLFSDNGNMLRIRHISSAQKKILFMSLLAYNVVDWIALEIRSFVLLTRNRTKPIMPK